MTLLVAKMIFMRDDWTLFRNLNTLGQKAGVPKDLLAALVLKELADNALDTGANAMASPDGGGGFLIMDEGPGIEGSDEEIASLFSIRRPLTSSKLFRLPLRGALGNGLRVVAGSVLASGGSLKVRTRGRELELQPLDDGSTKVVSRKETPQAVGTVIHIRFGPELNRQRDPLWMARKALSLRGQSHYEGKSSPWWYDSDSFYELLQGAAAADPEMLVIDLVERLAVPKLRRNVAESLNVKAFALSRQGAEDVLRSLRELKAAPKHAELGVIGEDASPHDGYAKKTATISMKAARGTIAAEIPAVIEVWAKRLEKGETPQAEIFVNRTPITATVRAGMKGGREGEMWIVGCGINNYFKTGRAPMNVKIAITAPYMPVTTDGKEPNFSEMISAIYDAITSATRKAKQATKAEMGSFSQKDLIKELIDEAIAGASGDGKHRYSLRQLFYAIRPLLQERGFEEPAYTYFSTIVGEAENERGEDLPGMYRDARGTFIHPHEPGRQMSLGTLGVEKYKRPEWRFNKVLYVEKGGFFPLLADAKWAERHDCALLTSQGFASRAARDLIDLLGESDEEITFFCTHDGDGSGTLIYQALVEGTLARPGRKVKVVNLGLEPWEAKRMGLISEKVERKKGSVPVARYVERYDEDHGTSWKDWLQENRYELNAMSSPQFLAWLDAKMEEHGGKKVIPPENVLTEKFREMGRKITFDQIVQRVIKELNLEDQADMAWGRVSTPSNLSEKIMAILDSSKEMPWDSALSEIAFNEAKIGLINK